ncbi:MAG: choice-of-anchor Q domain-containing protein [Anaerolineae bacterium]
MLPLARFVKPIALVSGAALVAVLSVTLALHSASVTKAHSLSTTFTVTNTNDSGPGSLREAIVNANTLGGDDVIDFNLSGCPCVIVLSSTLPVIVGTLEIVGPGADQLAIDGNNSVRVFEANIAPVIIANLTVRNGYTSGAGAGLRSTSDVILTNVNLLSNTATLDGGAVFVGGTAQVTHSRFENNQCMASTCRGGALWVALPLTISDTDFISNTAHDNSGAVFAGQVVDLTGGLFQNNRCVGVPCVGGAIAISGRSTITDTDFINNTSVSSGGAVFSNYPITVTNALFQGNHCTGSNCHGGGLNVNEALTVIDTVFISNTAQSAGGGLYGVGATLNGSLFQDNQCTDDFCNGGAAMVVGDLTLSATKLISNTSLGDGGALFADRPVTLTKSVFAGNTCTGATCSGGGLYAETTLTMSDTQFMRNSAGQGGGLFQSSGVGRFVNDLFVGNVATNAHGAALLFATPSQVEVIHTTIANPIVLGGSAVEVQAGTVYLTNTLIASHTIGLSNTAGVVTQDYNLFFGNGSQTAGAIAGGAHNVSGDPDFVNAGGADYHLRAGSAAIDVGTALGVLIDFEGDARPQGNGVDIGYDEVVLQYIYLPLIVR